MRTLSIPARAWMACLIAVLFDATSIASPVATATGLARSDEWEMGVQSAKATSSKMLARQAGTSVIIDIQVHVTALSFVSLDKLGITGAGISSEEKKRLQTQYDDYNEKHNLKPFGGLPRACKDQNCNEDVFGILYR
ncbi:hypothetical protein BJI69_04080 [Luteibacter rhizovicinus DSM 16549]|uniref:Uncharacterized protein n=1 Tax=Luteibacter rhizovicinus DSM 16549 TaxID=1440763 RepID=A0A0G9HCX6_9GAMM|nr:hypothetical protein [Luteibacter rhizovicinus]APG03163.1 hypothetical protein BJI69_04080 [Luteibacter rhizovicinus DSM 16549]KLD67595.1 hypothetical protein Y883_07050 [Luteibacter rhizovicinus DSM 16549]KLD73571.1 hypothetical protein Y886_37270 [Xanthomonas hyacinthi DSM 19077]